MCTLYSVILFCSEWKGEAGVCRGVAAQVAAAGDGLLVLGSPCDLRCAFSCSWASARLGIKPGVAIAIRSCVSAAQSWGQTAGQAMAVSLCCSPGMLPGYDTASWDKTSSGLPIQAVAWLGTRSLTFWLAAFLGCLYRPCDQQRGVSRIWSASCHRPDCIHTVGSEVTVEWARSIETLRSQVSCIRRE